MNIIDSTKIVNIDEMTVSELYAASREHGDRSTDTISIYDLGVAHTFGVIITAEMDTDGTLSHDEIRLELSDKPEHGWILVTRDAGDSEWLNSHEAGWSTYDVETLRSTIKDLGFATELAAWLNKVTAATSDGAKQVTK